MQLITVGFKYSCLKYRMIQSNFKYFFLYSNFDYFFLFLKNSVPPKAVKDCVGSHAWAPRLSLNLGSLVSLISPALEGTLTSILSSASPVWNTCEATEEGVLWIYITFYSLTSFVKKNIGRGGIDFSVYGRVFAHAVRSWVVSQRCLWYQS